MIESSVILLFIPTFFLVSLTPGMCMTLAMTLGMSVGIRRTMWMMLGELIGVAVVAITAVIGVATIMLQYPLFFTGFKILGACYLGYIAIGMFQSKGKLAITEQETTAEKVSRSTLFSQGLVTAIANPKGWAFMISLLPPFINPQHSITAQLTILVGIILISEFICMTLYALGGKTVYHLIGNKNNVKAINRISGSLMMLVAIWLVVS